MIANIRIRDDLYSKLKESAKNNCRTITGELEMLLIKTYASNSEASAEASAEASSTEVKEQPQKQTPRKNVIVGAEFDEDLNFNKEGKLTWGGR